MGAGAGALSRGEGRKEGRFSSSLFTAHPTGRLNFPGVLLCYDALDIGQMERLGEEGGMFVKPLGAWFQRQLPNSVCCKLQVSLGSSCRALAGLLRKPALNSAVGVTSNCTISAECIC